jgi:hypothetical protein
LFAAKSNKAIQKMQAGLLLITFYRFKNDKKKISPFCTDGKQVVAMGNTFAAVYDKGYNTHL